MRMPIVLVIQYVELTTAEISILLGLILQLTAALKDLVNENNQNEKGRVNQQPFITLQFPHQLLPAQAGQTTPEVETNGWLLIHSFLFTLIMTTNPLKNEILQYVQAGMIKGSLLTFRSLSPII